MLRDFVCSSHQDDAVLGGDPLAVVPLFRGEGGVLVVAVSSFFVLVLDDGVPGCEEVALVRVDDEGGRVVPHAFDKKKKREGGDNEV